MAERGGQAAADGFQYQYLTTLEALLDAAEGGRPGVAAAMIEPTGSPTDGLSHDPDAVDFALVDEHRHPIVVAQVKSGGADTVMSAPSAFAVLLRLVRARRSAGAYRLITNMRLHEKTVELNRVLAISGDPGKLRDELGRLLERSPKRFELDLLSNDELCGLSRAHISADLRDRHELRDQLRERIRSYRYQHRSGLGIRSAGRMSNHLVSEILRRASGESDGVFTLEDFRAELLTESTHLAYDLGNFDWGIMVGPAPDPPDIPRPDLLAQVRDALDHAPCGRAVTNCVILGPSGIGKTSLAAAYAHDLADSYDQIFWINADSDASLINSFRTVHDWLLPHDDRPTGDEAQLRDRVRALLSASAGRWLMILDNAADRRRLQPWIPTSGRGHVIITSTNQVSWVANPNKIEVQGLTPSEARSLVRLRMGGGTSWDEGAERAATDLSTTMEHWPLAIELACGYLAGCELGLTEVPKYLKTIRDLALDDPDSVPPGYPRTLVGAIRLALDRVSRPTNPQRPDVPTVAIASISSAAYFASRQIPLQLMLAAAVVSRESVSENGLVAPLVLEESPENSFNAVEVHRSLRSESLVQRDKPLCTRPPHEWSTAHTEGIDETISVNEIVQHVVRRILERSGDVEPILSRTAFHTQSWLAAFIDHGDEGHMLAVLPHVQSLAEHARRLRVSSDDLALLWGNLGGAYLSLGEFTAARNAFETELEYVLRRSAPFPVLELKIRVSLAGLTRLEGGPIGEILPELRRVRELASRLAESRPQDVANAIANSLTTLRATTQRSQASSEVAKLIDDFAQLQNQLPQTPITHVLAELDQINELLGDKDIPAEQAEQRCRALLATGRLSPATRAQTTGLLVESLALQGRWREVATSLRELEEYARKSPLNPQGIATTLHNVGLSAGLGLAQQIPDCRSVVSVALRIISFLNETHLTHDPDMLLKQGVLQLLDATCDGDEPRIRSVRRGLQNHDAAGLLAPDHETGWRLLFTIAVLTSLSVAPD